VSQDPSLDALKALCPGATPYTEASYRYVFLPKLKVRVGNDTRELDALLCLCAHSGYPTRLFLEQQLADRQMIGAHAANWTHHVILGRSWYSWSWTGVSADLPAVQVLLAHMKALK
jgi:hypothetical protein